MKKDEIKGNVLILSDTHFYHKNIIVYDGRTQFLTEADWDIFRHYTYTGKVKRQVSEEAIGAMNARILGNIKAMLTGKDDTVIFVGDLLFGRKCEYRKRAEEIRAAIPCDDVRLVFGNHDRPDELGGLFSFTYEQALLNIQGQKVFFSHYPCLSWPKRSRGSWHIYGHVHGKYGRCRGDGMLKQLQPENWKVLDAGVMNWDYKPLGFAQIREMLK